MNILTQADKDALILQLRKRIAELEAQALPQGSFALVKAIDTQQERIAELESIIRQMIHKNYGGDA